MARRRIFLVDGHSYLYRAFHATPYLSNSKGLPTNAVYAFLNMLKKLMNDEQPDTLVVVFDSKAPSFREAISKDYKAQRPPMPHNLSTQIPYVKAIVEAMGLPILEKEGFEADDIIGTVVERLKEHDTDLFIATSDKDLMQFVSPKVFIVDSMKGVRMGEKEVEEKMGLKPSLVSDYLALAGDSSDNIPGVPGIGDKTARELISAFGSLENIYRNIEKVERAFVREKLIQGRDFASMSQELATIRLDVPLDIDVESLTQSEPDRTKLRRLYRELEFTALYKEEKTECAQKKIPHEVALSQLKGENLAILVQYQGKGSRHNSIEAFAAFDGERVAFSAERSDLLKLAGEGASIATHDLKPLYAVALEADSTEQGITFPLGGAGVNGGTAQVSYPDPAKCFDTMLAAYLLNPLRKEYAIGSIIEEYLDIEITEKDPKQRMTDAVQYLPELKELFLDLMKETGVFDLFECIEMPLVEVLAQMESVGVKVDRARLLALSRDFDKRLNTLMKDIHSLAGEPFNINSPQQLQKVLFDTLKLPPQKKTKTGYSTDTGVLEILSEFHPLPKEILEYRMFSKLKNTYIDVLPTLVSPRTGRIHASFNQMVVATGRLSSSDPNLQNIPIRGEEGAKIREAFVPEDGYVLLSSDYSQIELRVLAHISQDPVLIDTFLKDQDIHSRVAQEVFRAAPEEVTQEMRRTAKVINFGIIYGISGYGLSKSLGVPPKEAQKYIEDYFERHKGVRQYIDSSLEEARRTGFVKTLVGRVRYIPELNNPDMNIRQLGERAAMNTPIQGTAADIIKIAMINIFRRIREQRLASRLIMQIHDELVLEVREDEVPVMEELVCYEMEKAVSLSVPLKVSIGKGKSWAEAHG